MIERHVHHRKKRSLKGVAWPAVAVVALLALVGAATAPAGSAAGRSLRAGAASSTFDQAVDELVAAGYPQGVVDHLTGLGDTPLGFRLAGGPADREQSEYIASEMRAAGLENVRLEPVSVDVYEPRGATVAVEGRSLTASQWPDVPGTPAGGISAAVVYVHGGLADDYRTAASVKGKIVLVDFQPSAYWVGVIGMEAKEQGAAGMILTSTRRDTAIFADADALASADSTYSAAGVPFVYVCRRDGDWLKSLVAAQDTTVTISSAVAVTPAAEGGTAYNVVGEITGSAGADKMIVIGAHQDAFFRGAVDDTSGVAGMLTIAKAMKISGRHPERTVVFVSHTAEEAGLTDSQYDWCIGSWRLLQAHRDWPGKVVAELELDEIGFRAAPLWALNVPELGAWLRGRVDRPGARLWPQDWITSYSDQWAYSARGIPSVYFGNTSDRYERTFNHTALDTASLLDYRTLARDVKIIHRCITGLGAVSLHLLPFDPRARVREVRASVSMKELAAAGCAAAASRYWHSLARLSAASRAYARRRSRIPSARWKRVNQGLLSAEKGLNRGLMALDWHDGVTYAHRTQLDDLQALDATIRHCRVRERKKALAALKSVSQTTTGRHFTYSVYQEYLARFDSSYERLNWAAWGRLPLAFNVLPEYRLIEAGRYRAAIRDLRSKRVAARRELERRLDAMSAVFLAAATRIEALK